MGEKVGTEKIERQKNYLYYVGKDGYVYRVPSKSSKKKEAPMKVSKTAVKREKGYLYFVGKSGYVERVKAKRGR